MFMLLKLSYQNFAPKFELFSHLCITMTGLILVEGIVSDFFTTFSIAAVWALEICLILAG